MTAPNADPDRAETRARFPFGVEIPTRWIDNDLYGHVNNALYYVMFDTVIARCLIERGGFDPHADPVIGLAVETFCRFKRPIAFPEPVEARLRIARLGTSSVRYEIGLFTPGHEAAAALGHFVHVFVDRAERRPRPLPEGVRAGLAPLATPDT